MEYGLSVCIITKNEELMLPDCLHSVINCADEIIVVDTGSEDNTKKIALDWGCKVFDFPWQKDFSVARNYAISKANFPYILSIDADERLINSELLKPTLRESESNIGGWLIEVTSKAKRKDGSYDTYYSNLLRLFKSHPEIRFVGAIHEQIVESIINLGYKLNNSELKILHLGYSHEPDQMKRKQLRNLELLDRVLELNPLDANNTYQRAKTYLALGNLHKAEEDISKALNIVHPDSAIKPQALNFGAVIAFQNKNYNLALSRSDESLKIIKNQSFANFIRGEVLNSLGNYKGALESYIEMSKAQSSSDVMARIVGDYHLPEESLSFRLGRCYVALNEWNKAYEQFLNGNTINPNDVSCLVGLSNVSFHYKNFDKSKELLLKALEIEPEREDVKSFLKQVDEIIVKTNNKSNLNIALPNTVSFSYTTISSEIQNNNITQKPVDRKSVV